MVGLSPAPSGNKSGSYFSHPADFLCLLFGCLRTIYRLSGFRKHRMSQPRRFKAGHGRRGHAGDDGLLEIRLTPMGRSSTTSFDNSSDGHSCRLLLKPLSRHFVLFLKMVDTQSTAVSIGTYSISRFCRSVYIGPQNGDQPILAATHCPQQLKVSIGLTPTSVSW